MTADFFETWNGRDDEVIGESKGSNRRIKGMPVIGRHRRLENQSSSKVKETHR